jgi:hypothetical protein
MTRPWSIARLTAAVIAAGCLIPASVDAQNDTMTPIATPAQADAIVLGTGPLPGATVPESWHRQYGSAFARNVTVATLTPYLADPAKASGAAVIVAPGGGFRTLSMENEGSEVARALAARWVSAFVLKYRLNQTPRDLAEFARPGSSAPPPRASPEAAAAGLAPQIADARAAFALVGRAARSGTWMPTDRHGRLLGRRDADDDDCAGRRGRETSLLGDIYGPMAPVTVPADAPPLFVALAVDDPLFGNSRLRHHR